MDNYQYEPLPSDDKYVRFVVLHPRVASRVDDIRVTIFKSPLEAGRRLCPSFMALSYVWGDADNREDLTVVSLDDDDAAENLKSPKSLPVTANLANALRHLPHEDGHLILWIDAICINQQDVGERAQQVKLMSEIYSSAERVLAWVGPTTHSSNVAMNLFHRIADSIDVDFTSFAIQPKESKWSRERESASMYFRLLLDLNFPLPWDGPESQAFEDFFNRPWFERLWVRQEITLGARDAVVLCGASSIEWSKFRKVAVFLNKKAKDSNHPRFEQLTARTGLVADTAVHSVTWLGQLLRQMQRTECADARDRVYGIMGILPTASSRLTDKIEPDYRKPVVQVYKELVLAEMEVAGRADLLSESRMADSTSPQVWEPSWVPNWTVKRERDLSMTQQCADGQSAVAASTSGQSLRITGVMAATVVDVIPIVIERRVNTGEQPAMPPVVALIKQVATKLDLSDSAEYRPSTGSSMLEPVCYALSGGHLSDHLSAEIINASTPSMAQFKTLIKFALDFHLDAVSIQGPSKDIRDDVLLCMQTIVHACRERALLITEQGYVGTGPTNTRPGDQISVMLGCMRPLVLRPQEVSNNSSDLENNGPYTVVGPCNAHGLNWGEALLGPLPDDTTFIWSPSGPNRDLGPAFRNKTTGEETVEDARIDWPLLETTVKEESFIQRAEKQNGGEGRVTMYKRPDAEYFEKKGVALKNFNLI